MDKNLLKSKIEYVNDILDINLPPVNESYGKICEAMRYSVLNGGKRLRAIMLLEAFRMFNDDRELEKKLVYPFVTAIECIHGYSLVHDDLPAMDNDVLRRGKPTTHVAYGHAMGVLTGDALLNFAFEKISGITIDSVEYEKYAPNVLKAISTMSVKAGYCGMIGGQVLDTTEKYSKDIKINGFEELNTVSLDIKDIDKLKYILKIYELKTSQLFEAALMSGATLGGANDTEIKALETAGYALGIAFQIEDDILDLTSDAATLGKSVNIDEKNDKDTVARLYGIEMAKSLVKVYTLKAVESLKAVGRDAAFLCELFESLVYRRL